MTRISVWQSRAHTAEHVSFPRLRLRIAIGMRMSSSFGGIVFKRSMDIALAGFLLAASLPLLAFAAIVIKLDSGGPVLFRQARMGRRSRRFQLLKLRTMRISSDGPVFTLGEDPRITRVGRWLRWLKVDELPQLWNVLRGEMSLVGPRPVVPELTLEFKSEYERLLRVRPGLTDPATLKYCREDELLALVPDPLEHFKTVLTPDKLRISQTYLEHANIWLDLGVLAGTVVALYPSNWVPRFGQSPATGRRSAAARLSPESVQGAGGD
jgi:lipopolysaccharide/colanic/teichoic acid biosynthesis glycosyltransferase